MLKRVRIPSIWYDGEGVADFQLGLGPCGKVVTMLELDFHGDYVTVAQITECGEIKRFHYHTSQITGRIEETYANG